jgi:hypothetical protein
MRWVYLVMSALPALAVAGCSVLSQPALPTREPFTALYRVKAGPYPLYEEEGEWLANRVRGLPLDQADELTMTARRVAQVQDRISPADGLWLHSGCIFDVQRTSPDPQEASYVWAYGRVVRCDELVASELPEPQMGIKPHQLRIYDGWPGYFPMRLLEPYTGSPPTPRPTPTG